MAIKAKNKGDKLGVAVVHRSRAHTNADLASLIYHDMCELQRSDTGRFFLLGVSASLLIVGGILAFPQHTCVENMTFLS